MGWLVVYDYRMAMDGRARGSLGLAGLLAGAHEVLDLVDLGGEEHALAVVAPGDDADVVGEVADLAVLLVVVEVAEEEAGGGEHALGVELPEADLVDDDGGQDRLAGRGGDAVHLLVGVGGEVRDDLVRGDAHVDGAPDRGAREHARHEAAEAVLEVDEERQHRDLQRRVDVRVQPEVGLEDDGAQVLARVPAVGCGGCRVARRPRGGEAGAHTPEGRLAARQGGRETSGEELAWVGRRHVHEAEVDEVRQHVAPGRGQRVRVVRPPQLQRGEEEEKRQHVDAVLALTQGLVGPLGGGEGVGGLEPEEEEGPDLRVRLLQQEGEARLRDVDAAAPAALYEAAPHHEVLDGLLGPVRAAVLRRAAAAEAHRVDDEVQDVVPLLLGVAVEEVQVHVAGDVLGGRHAEGVVVAAALERQAEAVAEVGRQGHGGRGVALHDVEGSEDRDGLVLLPLRGRLDPDLEVGDEERRGHVQDCHDDGLGWRR